MNEHPDLIILVLPGKHNVNNSTTTATIDRVGGGAEEKDDHVEGDLLQVQHRGGSS